MAVPGQRDGTRAPYHREHGRGPHESGACTGGHCLGRLRRSHERRLGPSARKRLRRLRLPEAPDDVSLDNCRQPQLRLDLHRHQSTEHPTDATLGCRRVLPVGRKPDAQVGRRRRRDGMQDALARVDLHLLLEPGEARGAHGRSVRASARGAHACFQFLQLYDAQARHCRPLWLKRVRRVGK